MLTYSSMAALQLMQPAKKFSCLQLRQQIARGGSCFDKNTHSQNLCQIDRANERARNNRPAPALHGARYINCLGYIPGLYPWLAALFLVIPPAPSSERRMSAPCALIGQERLCKSIIIRNMQRAIVAWCKADQIESSALFARSFDIRQEFARLS